MQRLDVVFGLHFYQPSVQKPRVLERITDECYRPLLEIIGSHAHAHFTVDIAGTLLEQLHAQAPDVLASLRTLITRGKISLVNTAAYHPILPLVPPDYAEEQLMANELFYHHFGLLPEDSADPTGVFPPEMAFSPALLPILAKLGYRWTVTDSVPFGTVHGYTDAPNDWIPEQDGVACFLRSNHWSNRISLLEPKPNGAAFARDIWGDYSQYWPRDIPRYVVLWMDAETFGHHQKDAFDRFLVPFLEECQTLPIRLTGPDTLLATYPRKDMAIPAGSWATDGNHMREGLPYPLWQNPKDPWLCAWWELAGLTTKIARDHASVRNIHMKALFSCQTWWWACYGQNWMFEWALPYFQEILAVGTNAQRKRGENLIRQLLSDT